MASNTELIGAVGIEVVADYSRLPADLAAAESLAQSAADRLSSALADGLRTPDTTPVKDAFAAVDDAAKALAQDLATSLNITIEAPDTTAVTEALSSVTSSADASAEAVAGSFGDVSLEAPDVTEVTGALDEVTTKSYETGTAVDDLGAKCAELLASGEAATAAEALSMALAQLGEDAAGAGSSIAPLPEEISAAGDAATTAAGSVDHFSGAVDAASESANSGTAPVNNFSEAEASAGESGEQAQSGVGGLAEKMLALGEALVITEGLREFGMAALEAADRVDDATFAIGKLGGGAVEAESTIAKLRDIAADSRLSFPELVTAAQRMTAFLGTSEPVPEILRAVGDAAEVMGTPLEAAAGMFTRIASSGDLSKRSLLALGLTLGDVAGTLGTTEEKAKDAFKALDQTDRITVLEGALTKFTGSAKAMNDDALGAMKDTSRDLGKALEEVGKALDPVVKSVAAFVSAGIVQPLKGMAEAFNSLPTPVKDTAVGLGLVVASVVPLTAAISAAGFALIGIKEVLPIVTGLMQTMGLSAGTSAVGVDTLAASQVAETIASEAASVAAVEETGSLGFLGAAATTASAATDGLAAATVAAGGALKSFGGFIAGLGLPALAAGLAAVALNMGGIADKAGDFLTKHGVNLFEWIKGLATNTDVATIALRSAAAAMDEEARKAEAAAGKTKEHKDATADLAARIQEILAKMGAQTAATTAQSDATGVVVRATKDWNEASLATVTAQQNAANEVAAHEAKINLLSTTYEHAKTNLNNAVTALRDVQERYDAGTASAADLAKAQKDVSDAADKETTAFKNLQSELGKVPALADPIKTAFDNARKSVSDTGMELGKIPGAVAAMGPALTPIQQAWKDLGFSIDGTAKSAKDKVIPAFDEIASKASTTLPEIKVAWEKVSGAVDKLAKTDLPAAIAQQQIYVDALIARKAPMGEIYEAEARLLELEIQEAQKRNEDASGYIIKLGQVKGAMAELKDATSAAAAVYLDLKRDIADAIDTAGKKIADNLIEWKNWGDVAKGIVEDLGKKILEDLVGRVFKALSDSVLNGTNLLSNLGKELGGIIDGIGKLLHPTSGLPSVATNAANAGGKLSELGTNAADAAKTTADLGKSASSASSAAGTATGSLGSLASNINVVSGAVSAVTGVIGLFQQHAANASLSLIELNTRIAAIQIGQLRDDQWQQFLQQFARAGEIWAAIQSGDLNTFSRLGDIWNAIRELQQHVDLVGDGIYQLGHGQMPATSGGGSVTSTLGAAAQADLDIIARATTLANEGLRNINLMLQAIDADLRSVSGLAQRQVDTAPDWRGLFDASYRTATATQSLGQQLPPTLATIATNTGNAVTATAFANAANAAAQQRNAAYIASQNTAEEIRGTRERIGSAIDRTRDAVIESTANSVTATVFYNAANIAAHQRNALLDAQMNTAVEIRGNREAVTTSLERARGEIVQSVHGSGEFVAGNASANAEKVVNSVHGSGQFVAGRIDANAEAVSTSVHGTAEFIAGRADASAERIIAGHRTSAAEAAATVATSVHGTGEFIAGRNDSAHASTREHIGSAVDRVRQAVDTARDHIGSRVDRVGQEIAGITAAVREVNSSVTRMGRDIVTGIVPPVTTAVVTGSQQVTQAVEPITPAVNQTTAAIVESGGTNQVVTQETTAAVLGVGQAMAGAVAGGLAMVAANLPQWNPAGAAGMVGALQNAPGTVGRSTVSQFFGGVQTGPEGTISGIGTPTPDWAQRVIDLARQTGQSLPINFDQAGRLIYVNPSGQLSTDQSGPYGGSISALPGDTSQTMGSVFFGPGNFSAGNIGAQDPGFVTQNNEVWTALIAAMTSAEGGIEAMMARFVAALQANIDTATGVLGNGTPPGVMPPAATSNIVARTGRGAGFDMPGVEFPVTISHGATDVDVSDQPPLGRNQGIPDRGDLPHPPPRAVIPIPTTPPRPSTPATPTTPQPVTIAAADIAMLSTHIDTGAKSIVNMLTTVSDHLDRNTVAIVNAFSLVTAHIDDGARQIVETIMMIPKWLPRAPAETSVHDMPETRTATPYPIYQFGDVHLNGVNDPREMMRQISLYARRQSPSAVPYSQ